MDSQETFHILDNDGLCPDCSRRGSQSKLKKYHISFKHCVKLCPSEKCFYIDGPFLNRKVDSGDSNHKHVQQEDSVPIDFANDGDANDSISNDTGINDLNELMDQLMGVPTSDFVRPPVDESEIQSLMSFLDDSTVAVTTADCGMPKDLFTDNKAINEVNISSQVKVKGTNFPTDESSGLPTNIANSPFNTVMNDPVTSIVVDSTMNTDSNTLLADEGVLASCKSNDSESVGETSRLANVKSKRKMQAQKQAKPSSKRLKCCKTRESTACSELFKIIPTTKITPAIERTSTLNLKATERRPVKKPLKNLTKPQYKNTFDSKKSEVISSCNTNDSAVKGNSELYFNITSIFSDLDKSKRKKAPLQKRSSESKEKTCQTKNSVTKMASNDFTSLTNIRRKASCVDSSYSSCSTLSETTSSDSSNCGIKSRDVSGDGARVSAWLTGKVTGSCFPGYQTRIDRLKKDDDFASVDSGIHSPGSCLSDGF